MENKLLQERMKAAYEEVAFCPLFLLSRTCSPSYLHRYLLSQSVAVQQHNEVVKKEIGQLRIDMNIKEQTIRESAKMLQRKNRELKDSQDRIHALEVSLSREVERREKEVGEITRQYQVTLADLTRARDNLTAVVDRQKKEIVHLRVAFFYTRSSCFLLYLILIDMCVPCACQNLGKAILHQRSELERFFLTSLEMVREQMAYRKPVEFILFPSLRTILPRVLIVLSLWSAFAFQAASEGAWRTTAFVRRTDGAFLRWRDGRCCCSHDIHSFDVCCRQPGGESRAQQRRHESHSDGDGCKQRECRIRHGGRGRGHGGCGHCRFVVGGP